VNDKNIKRTKIAIKKLHINWSDVKPPTEHAVYPMIRNLRAASKKNVQK
jgi:hypothetical protein